MDNTREFLKEFYTRCKIVGLEEVIVNNFKYIVENDKIIFLNYLGDKVIRLNVPDWFDEAAEDNNELNKCEVQELVFTERLKVINQCAFCSWYYLTEIVAPGVIEIKDKAFSNSQVLVKASFPCLRKIGNNAFAGCMCLSDIDLYNVTYLGARALSETSLSKINLHSLKFSGSFSLANCKFLRKVKLPAHDFKAGVGMFSGDINLESINAEMLQILPKQIFMDCKRLRFIHINSRMVALSAFSGCINLHQIKIYNNLYDISGSMLVKQSNGLEHKIISIRDFIDMLEDENKTLYQKHIEKLKKGRLI